MKVRQGIGPRHISQTLARVNMYLEDRLLLMPTLLTARYFSPVDHRSIWGFRVRSRDSGSHRKQSVAIQRTGRKGSLFIRIFVGGSLLVRSELFLVTPFPNPSTIASSMSTLCSGSYIERGHRYHNHGGPK